MARSTRDQQGILSWGIMRVTCEFEISCPHRLTYITIRIFLQAFTRWHVPCATNRLITGSVGKNWPKLDLCQPMA